MEKKFSQFNWHAIIICTLFLFFSFTLNSCTNFFLNKESKTETISFQLDASFLKSIINTSTSRNVSRASFNGNYTSIKFDVKTVGDYETSYEKTYTVAELAPLSSIPITLENIPIGKNIAINMIIEGITYFPDDNWYETVTLYKGTSPSFKVILGIQQLSFKLT